MTIHIALLRGINVGGKNKIKMADLRKTLESLGLARVQTYIQSGNILFESDEEEATLRQRIEQEIEKVFGLSIAVIIRTSAELNNIVESRPFSDKQIAEAEASSEGESLYVSMLLEEPHMERIEQLRAYDFKEDQFHVAGRDIYLLFHQSIRHSKLAAQVDKLGVPTTTRNWKTISKLVALSDEMADRKKSPKLSGHEQVVEYMNNLEHPLKQEIAEVRKIILSANEHISEHIKWNAPSFCYQNEDRVTFNLHGKDSFRLVFHCGSKVKKITKEPLFKDTTGLLEWVAGDRAIVTFTDMNDVHAKKEKLIEVMNRWLEATRSDLAD
ncbi:DUF1697 domain-containing protein [Paenibacillus sp. J2TS4]|uniref:DUF1697 domain-containing protein n=1 Tax=Paenibacillus sp. J2TS4 TaxID=2807194 RepID=UPI001B07C82C|nr:DUF1697 domain-containing protein [Paenibacillus sp. J2TS4]GIP33748.1 hypothetical protein J2TS4_29580 [Paenibacillus sp. J2TS4]